MAYDTEVSNKTGLKTYWGSCYLSKNAYMKFNADKSLMNKSHYFFGIKSPKVITVSEKRMVSFLPFERDSHYACHDVVRECFEAQRAEAEARVERHLQYDAGTVADVAFCAEHEVRAAAGG